jgi:hypothetical protein
VAEPEEFELRVAAAVRSMAADADTRFDALSIADDVTGRERARMGGWVGTASSVARMALLLALLLALLIGSALVVGPGTRPPAPGAPQVPASVTGRLACQGADDTADVPLTRAALLARASVTCIETTDDPRVAGTSRYTRQGSDDAGAVTWGDYRLEVATGTWDGRFYAVLDPDGSLRTTTFATGTGTLVGWTYAFVVGMAGDAQGVAGAIYPGTLPPGLQAVASAGTPFPDATEQAP